MVNDTYEEVGRANGLHVEFEGRARHPYRNMNRQEIWDRRDSKKK